MSDSLWPHGIYSAWNSPGQNTGVGSLSLLQGIFPTQGSTQIFCIAGRFFTGWAQGRPRNTEVGSLSLLQQTYLTQESNQGVLLCRQILYQLSYQGSPFEDLHVKNWATQEKVILFLRPFILFIVKLWYRNTTEHTFMYVCFYHASTIYC